MRIDASGRLVVVVGTGVGGFSGDGGPAEKAQLMYPQAIAFDGEGNLYITESGGTHIRRVSGGVITTVAGGDPGVAYTLQSRRPAVGTFIGLPYSIALDTSGSLYFSGTAGVSMVKNGILRTLVADRSPVTGSGAQLGERLAIGPSSHIAVDRSGDVYISQMGARHRIYRIVDGKVTVFAGAGPSGLPANGGSALSSPLNSPGALAFGPDGALYVAQSGVISRIKDGVITNVAGTGVSGASVDDGPALAAQIGRPSGIHVDAWGRLWIADRENQRLRVVADGVIRTVAGGNPSDLDGVPAMGAKAGFASLVSTPAGRVYFRESALSSVYTIEEGTIRRVAGTGTPGYNGDNQPARNAQLMRVADISLSPEGDILIADDGNYRIRRVRNGLISSVAGNGQYGVVPAGGQASSSPIGRPTYVAAGMNGEFYFHEFYENKIWKVGADGRLLHYAGGGKTSPSDGLPLTEVKFDTIIGIHIDSAGTLYILTMTNGVSVGRILRARDGKLTVVAGGGTVHGGAGAVGSDAYLLYPSQIKFDAAGRIFYGDSAIVFMIENGRVFRIAGNGNSGFGGDGGPAGDAELFGVVGLAVRPDGGIYVADGSGRLRLLTPEGEKCTYSVSPPRVELPATNQPARVRVDTQPGCPWSAASKTNVYSETNVYLTIDSSRFNTGSGHVTFHVPANIGPAKSATLAVAGHEVPVTQAAPPCTYKPDIPGYAASPSYVAVKFFLRSPSFCTWAIENTVPWARIIARYNTNLNPPNTGTWEMELIVDPNPGPARSAVIKIAGVPFPVVQAGSARPAGGTKGIFAHLAAGGSWDTTITLVNRGSAPARVWLSPTWVSSPGPSPALRNALKPAEAPMALGTLERELQPGESYVLETTALSTDPSSVGWATVESDGLIDGFAVFRQSVAGRVQEAVVPLARTPGTEHRIWFDNTAGNVTGVAYARTAEQSIDLDVQLLSPQGGILARGAFDYAFNWARSSFPLAWMIDEAFNQRGTLRISGAPAGTMSLVGLRFHPLGAFTTMPSLSTQSGDGAMAHIASGGSWATTVTLVNMGSTPAQARLRVFNPQGHPLTVPWTSPLQPDTPPAVQQVLERTLAPGEAWLLETDGPEWEQTKTGWVKLETTASVNGFAVFRQTVGARVQEAVVPLEKGIAKEYALAFDNGNGYVTGVALANRDSSPREVMVTIRDDRGFVLGTEKLAVPAQGQMSFNMLDRWIVTLGRRGVVEFSSPVAGGLGVLGLRFHPGGAVTTIPAMAK